MQAGISWWDRFIFVNRDRFCNNGGAHRNVHDLRGSVSDRRYKGPHDFAFVALRLPASSFHF